MRLIILGFLLFFMVSGFADSSYPTPGAPTTTSPTTGTTTAGGDTFGSMVQQQTSQAMQVFQNVNYQKLSGGENQGSFYGSSSSDSDSNIDPDHLFNIFSGS